MILDPWQKDFLNTKGHKILCTGRQVGKSVICSIDAGEYAATNKDKVILMIAPTERQAFALFEKTLDYLARRYPKMISKGKERPTKTKINLNNGTLIWCLPTGLSGMGIRFLTVHRLYADEASRIPKDVWTAVTPMLLTTGGARVLLSTPFGAEGYFYDVFINKKGAYDRYTRFSIDSETVMKNRKLCKTWTETTRDQALADLEEERASMTALEYAQEYRGEFLHDLRQVFSDDLLRTVCILKRRGVKPPRRDYFLGVDVAGMGDDTSTYEALDGTDRRDIHQIEHKFTKKTRTTDVTRNIIDLNRNYSFNKIGVDDGGLGMGVFDQLLETDDTRRAVIALNNATRTISRDGKKSKRLLKEDMYNNLLKLMERKEIKLLDDDDIYYSLKSIQFQIIDNRIKYFGKDSHIAEGLIRAAWCVKLKALNIWIL